MLRNIIIIKGKEIVYSEIFGETYNWEAISPLYMSLTYFLDEIKDDVEVDFMNTVHYKIAYSSSSMDGEKLIFIFVSDLGDPNDIISEQIVSFNNQITQMLGGA
ncbi:MAG: hypothetical protein GF329_05965 [Candidatus Lokiarchaeota archaeon]|nr:hypothetical protein [Candidatus Lokiarchaeota archaeon]